jgi:DHA3 family macrolide efflux protein-like MFS transporter
MFQTLIDPAKLGRVMSLYMTMAMLVSPVGLLLAGPLAGRVGVAPWFAVSGLLIAVVGALTGALPAVRRLDAAMAQSGKKQTTEATADSTPRAQESLQAE